jgi:hypothetical protein
LRPRKRAFDSDPADRKGSGVRRYTVSRSVDDQNLVMIDLEFDDAEGARALLAKLERIWQALARMSCRIPSPGSWR